MRKIQNIKVIAADATHCFCADNICQHLVVAPVWNSGNVVMETCCYCQEFGCDVTMQDNKPLRCGACLAHDVGAIDTEEWEI